MKKIIEIVIVILISPIFMFLVFFVPANILGLLFGFDSHGPLCRDVQRNTTTRIERAFFVVAPYSCQKNAGLLQPATNNLFEWLGEVPE